MVHGVSNDSFEQSRHISLTVIQKLITQTAPAAIKRFLFSADVGAQADEVQRLVIINRLNKNYFKAKIQYWSWAVLR